MSKPTVAHLRPLTPGLGAELRIGDLPGGDGDGTVELIWDALAKYHVVVLRGRDLSPEDHLALASRFGEPTIHPVGRVVGNARAVSTIEDTAERPPAGFPWHTDLSWAVEPPALGFLHGIVIPPEGGDTMWVSTVELYESLTEAERDLAERMRLVHAPDATLLATVRRHHGDEVADRVVAENPPVERPLVVDHPLSGRRALYLSPMYVTGPASDDPAQRALLDELHARLDDPRRQLRWRWRTGDVIIWDEVATCHRALTDHHPARRVVRRCSTQWPEGPLRPAL